MPRLMRALTTLLVAITFTVAVTVVKPTPAHASTDTTTIIIVLAGVFGGLAIIAIVFTLLVRNNPAWMPLAPGADLARLERDQKPPAIRFGPACGWREGGMPLLCWN